jgi:hypothetical protein
LSPLPTPFTILSVQLSPSYTGWQR